VYDEAAKQELVRRCQQPGVSLARTAMLHGVNANLLRKWVSQANGARPSPRKRLASPAPTLLAVKTVELSAPAEASRGYVELIVAGGTLRLHGRIDPQTLSVALDCLVRCA
jgi:transposase